MNMSIETRARIAFAAVVLLAAAAGWAWHVLASSRYATYQVRTGDAVSGLIVDAPVEFHGVEVGKVTRIELEGPRSVSILLAVRKEAPVTTATVATITGRGLATRGFTGYVYVSLEDAGTRAAPLPAPPGSRFPLIASAPSRSVNLDTSINQLNENVQIVTGLLRSVLDQDTVASLRQAADGVQQVTRMLAAHREKLGVLLLNAERASAQLQPLLQSSSQALQTLQADVLPEARGTLARLDSLTASLDEKLGAILLNTEQASTELQPLLQSSNETVRSLQTQILPQAYKTLLRLDGLSASLSETAARMRRDPSVLVRGASPPAPGPGETR